MQTAMDRVEKLTGQNNKLRQQLTAYHECPDNLASARALLLHIADNIEDIDVKQIRDSIRLELRKG